MGNLAAGIPVVVGLLPPANRFVVPLCLGLMLSFWTLFHSWHRPDPSAGKLPAQGDWPMMSSLAPRCRLSVSLPLAGLMAAAFSLAAGCGYDYPAGTDWGGPGSATRPGDGGPPISVDRPLDAANDGRADGRDGATDRAPDGVGMDMTGGTGGSTGAGGSTGTGGSTGAGGSTGTGGSAGTGGSTPGYRREHARDRRLGYGRDGRGRHGRDRQLEWIPTTGRVLGQRHAAVQAARVSEVPAGEVCRGDWRGRPGHGSRDAGLSDGY